MSSAPNKFLTPSLRHITATNFTFIRHGSSGESDARTEQSSTVVKDDATVDLTEDIIPEAPELPVEAVTEVAEKILVN